jgi:hypothetical protein
MKYQWKELFSHPVLEYRVMAIYLQLGLFAFCALLVGCTTTDYLGKTYPPTQRVDVVFSRQDVKRSYEVMGEIRAQADEMVSLQSVQRQLMTEAMQKAQMQF